MTHYKTPMTVERLSYAYEQAVLNNAIEFLADAVVDYVTEKFSNGMLIANLSDKKVEFLTPEHQVSGERDRANITVYVKNNDHLFILRGATKTHSIKVPGLYSDLKNMVKVKY